MFQSTKADLKSGKQSTTPAPRGPPSRGKTAASLGDRDRQGSPTSGAHSVLAHEDPVVDKKYKEKVMAQVSNSFSVSKTLYAIHCYMLTIVFINWHIVATKNLFSIFFFI